MRVRVRDPAGVGRGAWGAGGVSAESSPAHLRSSNRASLSGRAESSFSFEVGTAQMGITRLPNTHICKYLGWDGIWWIGPGYQTRPNKLQLAVAA
jgi:hypothetical protein